MWANLRSGAARTRSGRRGRSSSIDLCVGDKKVRIPKMEWNKEKREWTVLEAPKRNEETLYPLGDDGKQRIWSLGHETLRSSLNDIR